MALYSKCHYKLKEQVYSKTNAMVKTSSVYSEISVGEPALYIFSLDLDNPWSGCGVSLYKGVVLSV